MTDYTAPEADTKDWTWVLERRCPECGFDANDVPVADAARLTRDTINAWQAVLGRADVEVRPAPGVWSPLEYACHVRDVYELFAERVRLMLTQNDPQFANWDQDATAIERRYHEANPSHVFTELTETGGDMVVALASVHGAQWLRPGRRSNGSVFTVESLTRYFLHDVVHHLHDVGQPVT